MGVAMRTIGLIGGMSWESTAIYYRTINRLVAASLGGLHSAKLVMQSLDFEDIVTRQQAGAWDEAGGMIGQAGRNLDAAGADCLLICTNTMHCVVHHLAGATSLPIIDIIDETARAVRAGGHTRPLLLATRYTMEQGFYQQRMAERWGVQVGVPGCHDRQKMHAIIFDELCRGKVSEGSRHLVQEMVARGAEAGADCVILGCTEICLLVDAACLSLPCLDSTAIHAKAAVDFALAA